MAVLLSSVLLSGASQAYFGQSIVDGACDGVISAATWVKQNPGKAALGVATLTAAYYGYTRYGYAAGAQNIEKKGLPIDQQDLPAIHTMTQECAKTDHNFSDVVTCLVSKPEALNKTLLSTITKTCQKQHSNADQLTIDNCVKPLEDSLRSKAANKYIIDNKVTALDFTGKHLKDESLKILAKSLEKTNVESLNFSGVKGADYEISSAGLKSLTNTLLLPESKVTSITLASACINDEKAYILSAIY